MQQKKLIPGPSNTEKFHEFFFNTTVITVVDYIIESIYNTQIVSTILKKYKYSCECFRKEILNTKKNENELAYDLYAYLYDKGFPLSIEPKTNSGKIDLIAGDGAKSSLFIEVKRLVDKNLLVKNIGSHIKQLFRYLGDYYQQIGYLVLFNNSTKKLIEWKLSGVFEDIHFVKIGGKTIYLMDININPEMRSASVSARIKHILVTEEDIRRCIEF